MTIVTEPKNMQEEKQVITLDGPSGVGKGTISLLIANKLGWHYLDSGALYRVLAYSAKQSAVDFDSPQLETKLVKLALELPIEFVQEQQDKPAEVYFAKQKVTNEIRTEICGLLASKIAKLAVVRDALLVRQRAFLAPPGLVADGRDMGTVVFPQAKLKIFLEASAEKRAERRYYQLKERGLDANLSTLIGDVTRRDEQDRNRKVAPMVPASDAIVIDTTELTIEEVLAKVMELAKQMGLLSN